MNWMDILKAQRRDPSGRAVYKRGKPLKSQAGSKVTSGPMRDRTIRNQNSPVMEYDNNETSTQNNRMQLQNRYNTESQKLQQYQQQKKDIIASGNQGKIDAMDDNNPSALNNKIMSAQKLINSIRQNLQGTLQVATQGNMVRKPQERVPLPRNNTSVPLPSSTKPTERTPLPSSTKPTERVPLPKDPYQPPAKWERILNTRPPKPVMPTTSMPEKRPPMKRKVKRPPMKRKVIPSASPKQRAWEKSRLEAAANKVRNKKPEELSEGVKQILNPPVEERQSQKEQVQQQTEVQRRIAEEQKKRDETLRRMREQQNSPPKQTNYPVPLVQP